MKIIIISDIHDNIPNLIKTLAWAKQNSIDTIFCCGDLGSEATFDHLAKNFTGQIYAVLGNMDTGYVDYEKIKNKYNNVVIGHNELIIDIDLGKILLVHEPKSYRAHLTNENIKYIFHGHTHKPWLEHQFKKTILCPGNLANQFFAPGFAYWDTEVNKFKLIQVNTL